MSRLERALSQLPELFHGSADVLGGFSQGEDGDRVAIGSAETRFPSDADPLLVGLRLGNAMWLAVNGAEAEKRG